MMLVFMAAVKLSIPCRLGPSGPGVAMMAGGRLLQFADVELRSFDDIFSQNLLTGLPPI